MSNPYVQYPRAPMRRDISLEVIGEAWQIITKNFVPFIITGLMFLVVTGGLYFVLLSNAMAKLNANPETMPSSFDPSSIGIGLLMSVIFQVIYAGVYKMGLVAARGGTPSLGDFASIFPKIGSILLFGIITAILGTIGTYLCCLPGFIYYGLTMFTSLYIVDQDLPLLAAMGKSFEVLKPYLWPATLLYFVAGLASGLGAVACGIGVIITFSILPVSIAIAFRDLNDLPPGVAVAPAPLMTPTD